jgi:hypothetical protein
MKLNEITNLVEKVYFEVLDKLDPHIGDAHEQIGDELYESIENIIKKHLDEHLCDDREKMIENLTKSMLKTLETDEECRVLICREGFIGFENFSNAELKKEYAEYLKSGEK